MKLLTQGEKISKKNTTSNIEKLRHYQELYNACWARVDALIKEELKNQI